MRRTRPPNSEVVMQTKPLRRLPPLALSASAVLCACATGQLDRSTVATGRTATDILYAMVLDNLEMIKQEPAALPWHIKITQGAITINDSVTPTLSYASAAAISRTLQLAGTQSAQVSWTVVPVVDKVTLVALRGYYQTAATATTFASIYGENITAQKGKPCGSFGGTKICVIDMAAFTTLVTDILAITTVTAAERGVQIPGPQTNINPGH